MLTLRISHIYFVMRHSVVHDFRCELIIFFLNPLRRDESLDVREINVRRKIFHLLFLLLLKQGRLLVKMLHGVYFRLSIFAKAFLFLFAKTEANFISIIQTQQHCTSELQLEINRLTQAMKQTVEKFSKLTKSFLINLAPSAINIGRAEGEGKRE